MANAFDRFDTETAPKAKTGNPFDAFDEVAEAPAPEPYGPSRTSNAGRSFPDAASRKRSGGSQPQENYDSFVEATGKSLDNVPERLQQSFGGLVQMLGEDMGQERERFMQQSASRLGITPQEYKLLAWAGNEGLVDPETPVPDALERLKSKMLSDLSPEQQAQVADMGLINPERVAAKGRELRADAQSTMEPVNAEPGSAAYYTSAAIGSIAEMTPALLASVLTRNPATGMSIIGGQVGGESYGRARDSGKSVDEAQTYAMAQAAAEAIPEYLPISTILKPGANFLGKLAKTGAAESVQEMITAALQAGIDKEIIQPEMTWGEARQQIIDGGIIGLIAGPGMAAMMEPVIRLQDRNNTTPDESAPPIAQDEAPAEPSPAESGSGANPFDAFDETETEAVSVPEDAAALPEIQQTQQQGVAEPVADEPGISAPEAPVQQDQESIAATPERGEPLPGERLSVEPETSEATLAPEQAIAAAPEAEAESLPQEAVETVVSTPTSRKVEQAGADTNIEPTEGQKAAGNYKKGRVRIQGLDIAIENPKGSTRSGTDPDGNRWESTMAHHYGDIKGTKAADGDNLDVFIGPYPEIDQVFVIDQPKADGSFDEHKILLGYANEKEAREGYLANYEKGWKAGPITRMSMDDFKDWVRNGNTQKPLNTSSFSNEGKSSERADLEAEAAFSRSSDSPQTLDALKKSWNSAGVEASVSEKAGVIRLDKIVVPEQQRRSGVGSRAMQELTDYADATGQTIALSPSSDFGGNKLRLRKFYRRFGFVDNKGKEKDFEISESMYRPPNSERFSRDGEFRRTPEYQRDALTVEQAESIRDELMNGWKGAPDVIVRDQIDQFPPGLQAAIRLAGAENDMRGVFWNDTVYILASRIPDRMRMEQVILHEVIGHYGLRKMLGKDMERVLNQIWSAHGGKTRADFIIKRYFPGNSFDVNNKEHRHTVAEELIAHLAEQNRGQTLVQRAVAIIREGLRKLGFTIEFTVDDIVNLLRKARATVENGGSETDTRTEGAAVAASKYSKAGRSGSDRTTWSADFPRVPFAAPLGSADKHPRYAEAKSGDVNAAKALVDDIVNDAAIERIREMIGGSKPVVVAAFAEEATGRNKIPVAYAAKIAKDLDLTMDQEIIQSISVKRTGEGSDYRLANHAVFEGQVTPGQDYLIVDDTLTMGGTLASLRGHIEAIGGNVIGATTLTGYGENGQLALGEKMRQALWRKHGAPLDEYLKEQFGYGIDSLTQGEAGHFRKAESLERIRERIDAARAEISSDSTDGVGRPRFSRSNDPDDGIPVLNSADDIPVLQPEGPNQSPENAYDRAFKSLGDKDKTVFERAKKLLRRELTPGGLLPGSVFKAKLERDFKLNGLEFDIANRLGHFDDAVKRAYGKPFNKLPDSEISKINQALGGDEVFLSLPEPIRLELHKMRLVIKNLSRQYARHLASEIEQLQAQGADAAAATKIQLLETIIANLDTYVHRSYRAFDDPNWPRKVSREVYDDAARYLEQRYQEQPGISKAQAQEQVSKTLELILEEGTAFDSMEGFIKESKLGAKDLSVLQRRKQVAPQIRALLGEYTDPKVNFSKSVTKMARLIMNQRFLDKVRDLGLAEGFLFEKENRKLDATRQIAADASEVYAPLNGLYTYPEVEQAFKDALGKEQMADWFRTIVRLNGMVKYGKTVLSPTTAARNWMSASFFAMANGHFDFTQMTKSVQSVREYFTHGEGKDGYLRKMKRLGVIYDTPYAGEMMDLLADSQLENDLFSKRPFTNLRRFNEIAQKFYQYGDDFWKILGFENEKALLIKHKGLTSKQAEIEAAERIRNTYPTYSMTGRFVQRLRRFPLAGTFVSFPAEIVRTSYHILRYAAQDLRQSPSLGRRKLAGLAIASGMIHALQGVAMALVGMDDDEEEAFRDLAAPWMENSNLLPLGRNEKGQIRLIDMSFLDPYNYFKRPVNALLRDQPLDDAIKSAAVDLWSPFFGQDIAFGAISEALSNQKESGGRVFNPHAPVTDQAVDIANHMRKALQPGIAANLERIVKASRGEISASGRPYSLKDEGAALVGFRITTFDPKASIYYKAFEFQDKKRDATSILSSVAKNPNEISDSVLRDAYITAEKTRTEAYEDMIQLIKAGMNAGLTRLQIAASLRNSGVSKSDTSALVRGIVPPWKPSSQMMRGAINKAQVLFDDETAQEFNRRRGVIQEAFQESLRKSRQNQKAQ
ncbi:MULTISPECIES: hypothetical protein [unclassified Marinobacter]|uniref:hypothetical protein n=1 Tax=unclassified Marinobacter TaxID=83889 RepID=UPI0019265557|nr:MULTISPECIES: hypothetical protein [unclassified Marinobacter]MBL3825176.1 hypothetical protein [Marinobacter sp. MC3]MBL3893620.1 hypothetical protein [Marinobacter sp. MW3]